MSIIGPRPGLWNQDVLTAERDKYGANDVKPGLTGWAQINGRDELEIPEKAKLDGYYVQNMGFKMDAKVFLRSVHVFGKDESVVEGGTGEMKKQSEEKKIKKKILVICQYYKPEPFRISDICEEMVRRGHEVHVVTGYPNYPEGIIYEGYGKGKYIDEVVNGVKIHRCYTIPRETGIIKRMLNYYSYAVSSTRYVLSNKCIASDISKSDELVFTFMGGTRQAKGLSYVLEAFTRLSNKNTRLTLGEIVDLLEEFKAQPVSLMMPKCPEGSFAKKLFSLYLTYLPADKFKYAMKMNCDDRGSFTELVHTVDCGQVSINISKPGITKGQHWHNSKWEQFIVVHGHGLIQERNINTGETVEFEVSGDKIEAIYMIPGWTHNIINLSETDDLVTVMTCNEIFDPGHPDTFFEPV